MLQTPLISYKIKKNSSVAFAETSYVYVSKGSLSIGEIKLSGKVARGVRFSLREKLPIRLGLVRIRLGLD